MTKTLDTANRNQVTQHRHHRSKAYFLYNSAFGRFPPAPNGFALEPFEHPDDSVPDGYYQVRYQTSITNGELLEPLVGAAPPSVNVTSAPATAMTPASEPGVRHDRFVDVEQVLLESPQHRENLTDHRKYQMLNDIEARRQGLVRNERINSDLGHGFHLNQVYRQELTTMAGALSKTSATSNQAALENSETALIMAKRAREIALMAPQDNTPHYLKAGIELLSLFMAGRAKGDGTTDAIFDLVGDDGIKAKREHADAQAELTKVRNELKELREEKARRAAREPDQAQQEREQERAERERLERERLERERLERERVERERLERERVERERLERERLERERLERERLERERLERERLEQERENAEKTARETAARETAERERADRENEQRQKAERQHETADTEKTAEGRGTRRTAAKRTSLPKPAKPVTNRKSGKPNGRSAKSARQPKRRGNGK